VTQFGPKVSEMISQRRFLPKLFICKRKIHHKGRKLFFPTVSIRSESVRNDFSEKVFVKIKLIHILILSYSLNSVQKHLKRFLEKVFLKITQFLVCPLSVSIDYTLLLGARRSCGQFLLKHKHVPARCTCCDYTSMWMHGYKIKGTRTGSAFDAIVQLS